MKRTMSSFHCCRRSHTRLGWMTSLALAGLALATPPLLIAQEPAGAQVKQDQAPEQELTDEQRAEQRAQERERRLNERREREEQAAAEAQVIFEQLSDAYLHNRWDEIGEHLQTLRRHRRALTREQRAELDYITRHHEDYRPDWWDHLSRLEENSFEAEIWGRDFWANYYPTRELGLQAVIPEREFNPRTGEYEITDLKVIVTWKPLLVDNEDPAEGRLAKIHDCRLADLAEFICWHELGHNYITVNVPMAANLELYQNHSELYSTLHEYYADLTALYHCSPRARRVVLMFRLEELDNYDPGEPHRRGEHAIGAILLADILDNPEAWPSVHLPPSIPSRQVELNTIIYIYEHMETQWSVAEDIRVRELASEYVLRHGERTFRSKGEITLPNDLKFSLMSRDDREDQRTRDQWVTSKLSELAEAGRTDTLAEGETYNPPLRSHLRDREIRIEFLDDDDPDAPLRIKVPW